MSYVSNMLRNTLKRTRLPSSYKKCMRELGTVAADESQSNTSSGPSSSGASESKANNGNKHMDEFTKDFMQTRIEITPLQKLILGAGSSIAALLDPRRHDMIACLGETTGESALRNILYTMRSDKEGERILAQKPRINTRTVDLKRLQTLPKDTLGYAYIKFLQDNNVTPDSREPVRFMDDVELAYIMTRYRECHDLVHTILDMPTNMLGEVAVKWVEALNNGLPMCYGGAVFGAFRLRPKQRKEYTTRYLPWAIKNGKQMKPLMSVYWEERWEQNVTELRHELGIVTLK